MLASAPLRRFHVDRFPFKADLSFNGSGAFLRNFPEEPQQVAIRELANVL
jgi:hypothetical protein